VILRIVLIPAIQALMEEKELLNVVIQIELLSGNGSLLYNVGSPIFSRQNGPRLILMI
jgi:hypothetical protein